MNSSTFAGIIILLLGTVGIWASRIKYPNARYFPDGSVFDYTRLGYFLALLGAFLIAWGVFAKISNFTVRAILKVLLVIIVLWIGYQFYQTNIWDWQRFVKF